MQGVPLQFSDEKDRARFRHLEQLPGVELYHAHISRYAFEPHTHEAFGIGVIEQGAERFRYRGSQHIAAANSIVTMNPDELHTGEAETADGWRYRMIYLEPDRLEAITGVRDWWFSEVVREDPLRSRQIGQLIYGLWHSDDPLAQQGLLLDLIDAFRPLAHHASAQGEAGHRFDRVRDYLHDNYMRPITLDELAQVAALSPYHFQRPV
ncbi:AraC family transcriptional regulator [Klebsiella pneumoniae]|uniref:AraC family transcriptional regulator n=1 Tax=Klebsiella pneumoniae TaxID=573 RepID=A0A377ZNX5_KLEPN|nr:AraC family transcriptional regulator [Klebsiella pneumoniae]